MYIFKVYIADIQLQYYLYYELHDSWMTFNNIKSETVKKKALFCKLYL